jgi:solute:Na+ symporter, SSS family
VLVTDLFQFVVKLGMVIVLAYAAVSAVGGIDPMKEQLAAIDLARAAAGEAGSVLSFVPNLGSAWMPMITFLVYISVNWWATWYPGRAGRRRLRRAADVLRQGREAFPAGDAVVQHRPLRCGPWPWILVGLASPFSIPAWRTPKPATCS